jgi:sortase (surface protein transpeptidase)
MTRLRRRDWLIAGSAGVLVAAVAWVVGQPGPAARAQAPEVAGAAAVASSAVPQPAPTGPLPLPAMARVVATSVEIPAIGVRSALAPLRLDRHGVLQPPVHPDEAGWFSAGVVPGDRGPAVIAGHLDSFDGPAVFLRLGQLRAGDLVIVHRSDGTAVTFRVESTDRYAKVEFPTLAVYGPTPLAALRLITCGGAYDHEKKRYPDDVVVFAEVA